jgi:heme-degrading monooxygenase HmoA
MPFAKSGEDLACSEPIGSSVVAHTHCPGVEECLTHVRVSLYTVRPNTFEGTLKRTIKGLAPSLLKLPGFISYEIIQASESKAIIISRWQSREAADAAVAISSKWMRQSTTRSVLLVEDYIGDVRFSTDGG